MVNICGVTHARVRVCTCTRDMHTRGCVTSCGHICIATCCASVHTYTVIVCTSTLHAWLLVMYTLMHVCMAACHIHAYGNDTYVYLCTYVVTCAMVLHRDRDST